VKPRSTAKRWPRFSGSRFWLPKLLALFCWGILAAGLVFLLLLAVAGQRYALHHLLAALAGAAGLAACFRARPMWRPAAALLGSLVGLLALEAVLARGPGIDELEAEGGELVRALEHWRREHGRYPASLAEAGLAPAWNRFGGWRYEAGLAGGSFDLVCGEYPDDYCVLYYSTESGAWTLDR